MVKSPNGYPSPHPHFGIANPAMKQMHAFLEEFGMTPSARARVAAGEPPTTDPFDDLLRG